MAEPAGQLQDSAFQDDREVAEDRMPESVVPDESGLADRTASIPSARQRQGLDEALVNLQVPPPWLDSVVLEFDMSKPWNKAWDHIEILLEQANEDDRRRAIKLAYLYQVDGRAKVGYPAAVYFLAGEYAWSIQEHLKLEDKNTAVYTRLASCYAHFGAFQQALDSLERARESIPPDPPWNVFKEAQIREAKGDVFLAQRNAGQAKQRFAKAIEAYQAADVPAKQQHMTARGIARVETKIDRIDRWALVQSRLNDGEYVGEIFGYTDVITARVTVTNGEIADIQLTHKEKADLGAKRIIPRRIIERQGIDVDAITGATVTSEAIKNAVYAALKTSAGL